ncbi:hypothetical protein ACFYRN_10020 [Streptomyces sp. NPDC005227]|uniref:hypothetical protein n=1 Tax=Streptomyces sp. NPDC005227 TaxID=3364707 RepID=UPI0036972973
MAFPQTPLDIKADLKIGGVWTDVTADVYTRDLMTITRGRPDEGARSDPGKITATFNNGKSKIAPTVLGRYSTGNPLSDLYGKIGRNTPFRIHLPAVVAHLELDGDSTGTVSTPHAAAMNVTDLDVRCEFDADLTDLTRASTLLGKWGTTDPTRSWLLRVYNGDLSLFWVPTGGTINQAFVPVEDYSGGALRVTLDVNNGAGGLTARFYQADTLDGPWTQFYPDLVGGSTTSIQTTTSPLSVAPADLAIPPGRLPFIGTATRFQVMSGIDGTVIASPDFRPLADGATSFADSAGRTWTVNGTAKVRKREDRFNGEISAWPPRWDVSGKDAWVPVEAAGILRRYGQGAAALQSPLRRRIPGFAPQAYWPMEEGSLAGQASSPITGVPPLKTSGVTWAQADTLISSAALPVLAGTTTVPATLRGAVPPPAAGTTGWQVVYLYRLDTAPTILRTFLRITGTGTVREWYLQTRNNQSRILGLDGAGATVVDQAIGTGTDLFGQWISVAFRTSESAGTVTWTITWQAVGGSAGQFTTTYSGTAGVVSGVSGPPDGYSTDLNGMAIGHIGVFPTTTTNAYRNAITAWQQEAAGERCIRLSMEEGVPFSARGILAEQQAMGPQKMLPLLDLLGECADSDGGILMEHRARPALRYRGRTTMYSQTPALTLDYTARSEVAPPLEPAVDDAETVNDVTVTRIDGSSARVTLDTGALSTQSPPNGVGRYDTSESLSLGSDDQTEPIAYWRLHFGTWDAPRYPTVHVDLSAAPHLIGTVLAVDQGDVIRIINPPPWLPPGDINLIVQGYTESFDQYAWDIVFTCTPADPWLVAEVPIVEDFEDTALDVTITGGGTLPWLRTSAQAHTGSWSLRSGAITHNQTSDAIVAVPAGAKELRFWYWTSSEASGSGFEGDRLLVLVDGTQVLRAQGTTGWTQAIVDVTGKSAITFRYIKDNSTSVGSDFVAIDNLEFGRESPVRGDTDGSQLAAGATSTATSLSVAVTAGPLWPTTAADPAEFPINVLIGGEEMRVTGASGTSSPQTFTVVRSVNSIVKAQTSGTDVRLADMPIIAL